MKLHALLCSVFGALALSACAPTAEPHVRLSAT